MLYDLSFLFNSITEIINLKKILFLKDNLNLEFNVGKNNLPETEVMNKILSSIQICLIS